MNKLSIILLLCFACVGVFAQSPKPAAAPAKEEPALPVAKLNPKAAPMDIARAAFAAQGGETYRKLKNLMLTGSLDVLLFNLNHQCFGAFCDHHGGR
jgi:hypothetical protein